MGKKIHYARCKLIDCFLIFDQAWCGWVLAEHHYLGT